MTNAELIDALRYCLSDDYVKRGCCKCPINKDGMVCGTQDDAIKYAADALEAAEQRIAELIPKEGEWMFSRGDGKTCVDGWTCSACGNSFHTNVPYFEEFHYCPNCGARMKGEEDER